MRMLRAVTAAALAAALTFVAPAVPAQAAKSPAKPTISKVSGGNLVAGTAATVTITGKRFKTATRVLVGSVEVTIRKRTDTKLTLAVPGLPKGSYKVTVQLAAGGRATSKKALVKVRTAEQEVLRLVNAARGKARKCGSKKFKAVKALTADSRLNRAASAHAQDMAERNYFAHETAGTNRSPRARIEAAGVKSSLVGENIAAGHTTPAAVVNAWLKSPGHCRNVMNGKFRKLGVGIATNPGSTYRTYWVQDFAR